MRVNNLHARMTLHEGGPSNIIHMNVARYMTEYTIKSGGDTLRFMVDMYSDDTELNDLGDLSDNPAFIRYCQNYYATESIRVETQIKQNAMQNGGMIQAWRSVEVPMGKRYDVTAQPLGVFWSWEPDADLNQMMPKVNRVVLEGLISPDHVDWFKTLSRNVSYLFEEEREIRVLDNSPIRLVGIEADTELVPTSLPLELSSGTPFFEWDDEL